MVHSTIKLCPLFDGLEDAELDSVLSCLTAKTRRYDKETFIFHAGDPPLNVGIVLSGSVHVIQEDYWGNRTILAHVVAGDMFGEAFSCAGVDALPVSVVAVEDCEIMLADYRKIVSLCPSACRFHMRLITNMLSIVAKKNLALTHKVRIISRRTTREKLLAFLSERADQKGIAVIPFSRQQLADFLCVERSALSRELSVMKREGLLNYEKNRFDLSPRD